MIELCAVGGLLGRWWYNYDKGDFAVLRSLLTEDVHFQCRTDTGTTDYEEFVRADIRGRDEVMAWQTDHRLNSPFPLRHNGNNLHLTKAEPASADFCSYIFVTKIVSGVPLNLSSGLANGSVRLDGDELRSSALEVVLDTMESVDFSTLSPGVGAES